MKNLLVKAEKGGDPWVARGGQLILHHYSSQLISPCQLRMFIQKKLHITSYCHPIPCISVLQHFL
jgi:hypothetical protein